MRLAVACALLCGLVLAPAACDLFLYFVYGSVASRGVGDLDETVIIGGTAGVMVAVEIVAAVSWAVWTAFQWGSYADSCDRATGQR